MRLPLDQNPDKICLRCGKRLPEVRRSTADWSQAPLQADDRAYRKWRRASAEGTGTYGRKGNNAFCSAGCAEDFAVLAAEAGYRLVTRPPAEWVRERNPR